MFEARAGISPLESHEAWPKSSCGISGPSSLTVTVDLSVVPVLAVTYEDVARFIVEHPWDNTFEGHRVAPPSAR